MKNIFKALLFSALFFTGIWSCKKDEHKIYYKGGTAPVLTPSSTAPLVLDIANKNNEAISFSWTNPEYQFTTGVSSQDVSYTLQFDTTGSNFSNPNIQEKSLSKDLSTSVTVKELNTYLAKLGLAENLPHNMEARIKSALGNGNVPLYSNVVKFVATPYLDVAVPLPSSGNLYLVGSATKGGWNNPVPEPTQVFTKTSSTTYEITIPLTGGMEYLILPVNGSWSNKYAVKNNPPVSGLNMGGDFGYNLNDNFPGPAVSGNYKIVVDFKIGKFTVTKL